MLVILGVALLVIDGTALLDVLGHRHLLLVLPTPLAFSLLGLPHNRNRNCVTDLSKYIV